MIEVRQYVDRLGTNNFRKWLETLPAETQFRILAAVARLANGNLAVLKAVGAGVSEIRFHFGPGYRVYAGRDGDTLVILLGGGSKQRQSDDIAKAKDRWREYKQSKQPLVADNGKP